MLTAKLVSNVGTGLTLVADFSLLARGASNAMWHSGCLAPDRCVESTCGWLIRGPLFCAPMNRSAPAPLKLVWLAAKRAGNGLACHQTRFFRTAQTAA
jgi:hypothetical protein